MYKESDFRTISEFPASEYGKLALVANNKGEKYRKKIIELKFGKEKYKLEFQRAINILIRMNHPAINRILFYSLPTHNNDTNELYRISIFSDFEVNGSLADLIRSISNGKHINKWDPTHKMITIFGVAASLMYIHGCRLIYRNLKSTNVLFNSEYEPKLADFNFHRPSYLNLDGLTFDSTLVSIPYDDETEKAPLYTAPEILGNLPFNNKVDVYSYGILLYELFVNKEPDFGLDDQEAIKASIIIGNRPPIPTDLVPSSYQKLITECWDNNSSNRPSFKSIVRRLASPEYILPNVDFDKYIEYTKRTLDDHFLLKDYDSVVDLKTQGSRADELQSKADSGDVESQYKYAIILETGDGAIRNTKEAMKYYKMACFNKKERHLPSMHALARLYESQQRWEEAEVLFRTAADEGYRESQFHYAVMLTNGSGAVEKDIFKAAKFFKLAADQGEIDAQNFYANILMKGEGAIMNKKLAAEYFKRAADQGDGDAQNSYGMMLKDGCGGEISKNRHLAKEYLRKSAESGNLNGMLNYGDFLREEVDPTDQSEKSKTKLKHAAFYYLKSARLGSQIAQEKYDQIGIEISKEDDEYFNNLRGSDEYQTADDDLDKLQLHEAADKGDAESQYQYAMALLNEHNKAQLAVTYLEMAASQNHPQATLQLARMLCDGIGSERDYKQARRLFLRAAEDGLADAMASYGYMRYKGLGFANPNPEEALQYLEKSVQLESGDGLAFLGKLIEKEDQIRSEKLIKESARMGNSNGEYFLAMLNRQKNASGRKEPLEVDSLLRSSASKGNVRAQYQVALLDDDLDMLKVSADRGVEDASFTYASKIKEFDFSQAVWYFTKAAERENNAAAMVEVAKSLWSTNPNKCSTFLKRAIKQKYPRAYTLYGRYLIEQKERKKKNSLIMSHLSNFTDNDNEFDLDTFDMDLDDGSQKVEEEAAHYYHIGASLNDTKGMLYYGLAFRDGLGVSKNYSKAHKYLKRSADAGDVEGMVQLALFTDDESESIEYLKRAAKSKSAESDRWCDEARYYLAMIYKDKRRYSEAFPLLLAAAKDGHEDALFQVAVFYQNGLGVPANDVQAMNYYALSANSPNAKAAAQFNFALMLKKQSYRKMDENDRPLLLSETRTNDRKRSKITRFNSMPIDQIKLYDSIESFESVESIYEDDFDVGTNGKNRRIVKNNLTRAAKYFRAAALQGDAEAMNNYGLMLMRGEGVPQNLKEAQKYFQNAAEQGNSFGQNNLGVLLKNIDPEKATELFRLSAEQNNLSGMNNLGLMLISRSNENDRIEALSMFKAAADQNHPNAMFNYASLIIKEIKKGFQIYDDKGTLISIEKVMDKYMKKSADLGDIDAMNRYGSFVLKNRNDNINAERYFRMAAEAGNSSGMNKLATLFKFQLDDEKNSKLRENSESKIKEMIDWYEKAAALENTVAMNNLALLYYSGAYVKKDLEKAKEIYKKAMNLGDKKAAKMFDSLSSQRKKK